MIKVTNKHTGTLHIAGQDARPGATVAVEEKAFEAWSKGNGAKTWLDMKLVTVEGSAAPAAKKVVSEPKVEPGSREDLEARATKAGIGFDDSVSDDDLLNAILSAEQSVELTAEAERQVLLEEARALGLNPNKNTGIEKLKAQIADKKAS